MACSKVISEYFRGKSEKNHTKYKIQILSSGQDLNLYTLKYKTEVLIMTDG